MRGLRACACLAALSAGVLAGIGDTRAAEGPARFAGTPTATRGEIAFAVSAPVDVTVRIVDAKGEVVRHLACGMVGLENAAKPFAPKSLAQKLAWDGNDDAGKPVLAGSKVVIALGTRAKFDKFVLSNPDGFGNLGNANWSAPGAIAVGPKGELFVVEQYGVHYSTMRVFDREGKYLRTVWPLSMDKPREVLEPFLAGTMTIWPADVAPWNATDWAGHTVPRSVMHSAFYWYGVKSPSMVVGPKGDIFFEDAFPNHTVVYHIGPNELPLRIVGKMPWQEKTSFMRNWNLAVGPEGDVYVSDRDYGIVAHLDATMSKPVESFTFNGAAKLDKASYILGDAKAGQAKQYDPLLGLAVDKERRVWVASSAEKCIKVYDKDGRLVSTISKIATKDGDVTITNDGVALAANLASGAVYANVPGTKPGTRKLVKLASPDAAQAAASLDLPAAARRIAADGEGNLVWVIVGYDKLMRVQDLGDRFEARTVDGPAGKTVSFPRLITLDPTGRLYVADAASYLVQSDVEGESFKRLSWYGVGGHGYSATDAGGNLYVPLQSRQKSEVWKFTPDGKRAKFGDLDAIAIENAKELKGICVARNGDIYVAVTAPADAALVTAVVGNTDTKGEPYNFSRVDVYSPDGALKTRDLVRVQGINDVKLDREGNVYVIEAGTCHGAHKRRAAKLDNLAFTRYNALMKFAPTGGVRDGKGQLWTYRGFSGTSSYTCGGECPAGQVSLDADDRAWVCDAAVYDVQAIDGAGNLMFRIGTYGNMDAKGGGGDALTPGTKIVRDGEIPLACPFGVAVWKDRLFISDMYSHRVVRCRLEAAETKEIPLP